jgi:hypothetical protein
MGSVAARGRLQVLGLAAPLAIFLIGVSGALTPARSQIIYSNLQGTVVDTQGGVIPGATVVLRSRDSGMTKTSSSGADGSFKFFVTPGRYELNVEMEGFKSYYTDQLNLSAAGTTQICSKLSIGQLSDEVIAYANVTTPSIARLHDRVSVMENTRASGIEPGLTARRASLGPSWRLSPADAYDDIRSAVHIRADGAVTDLRTAPRGPQPSIVTNIPSEMCRGEARRILIRLTPETDDLAPRSNSPSPQNTGPPGIRSGATMTAKLVAPSSAFLIEPAWPEEQQVSESGAVYASYVTPLEDGFQELVLVVADTTGGVPRQVESHRFLIYVCSNALDQVRDLFTNDWKTVIPWMIVVWSVLRSLPKRLRRWWQGTGGTAADPRPQLERRAARTQRHGWRCPAYAN